MKWQRKKLGDVIEFLNGKKADLSESGNYVVYGSNGIIGKSNNYRYENAIIIGRVGAYCGSIAYCPNKFWASDNTIVAKPKHNGDVRFFSYFLHNFGLNKYAGGAAQPLVTQTVLKSLEGDIPNPTLQRKIASILSAYDDLIENNTRRIAILEEMARRIYEEWFVRFRFPGHEQVKMVESELGFIPEGWKVQTVEETFEILGGGTPSTKNREYWENGDINWFSPTDLTSKKTVFIEESEKKISSLGLAKSSARLFPAYSVMMTSRATLGVIAINTQEACTNQGFITCIPNQKFPLYILYYWLLNNVDIFISLATGATFKEITKGNFKKVKLYLPSEELITHFNDAIQPLMNQLLNLQRKKDNLCKTRDLLLPKLISGEVDVSHFPETENV